MKRAMLAATAVALAMGFAGCSAAPADQAAAQAEAAADWTRPPLIERVGQADGELVITGTAQPGGRVVLRNDAGAAFAASADSGGRFEIRMARPQDHLLLRPETQVGQDAAPSPDRLLILAGGRGPIAVLRFGGPTRRLDAAPPLGAVDSDGRMRLASGLVKPGTSLVEVESGGGAVQVVPDADGRWSLMLPPQPAPDRIRVSGGAFDWPGEAGARDSLTVEQVPGGWRIGWSGPSGARQSTWLPAAAAAA